jgi:hypothetical protein
VGGDRAHFFLPLDLSMCRPKGESAVSVAVREGAVAVNVPDDGVSVPDDGVSVPSATP